MPVQVTITWRRIVAGLLAFVVLALAGVGVVDLVRSENSLGGFIDPAKYQSVVLTSGAIYFGHLRVVDDDFYVLRDAFFIQETSAGGKDPARRVLPLGQELHGPESSMMIARNEIVLVENLRADSPVAKAAQSIS